MQKISVLIPTHNRLRYTKKCLQALAVQSYKNKQVIIIDSGSSDGTVEYITKYHPDVLIIRGDASWWWTKCMVEGANLALGMSKKGDFILEMNDDCYFDKNYLQQLLTTAQKHPRAIIGSLCVDVQRPTYVVEAGIRINWPTGTVYGIAPALSTKLNYFQNMEVIDKLDALPGKGTLVPVKVFEQIGNFDSRKFPHYIADYEFTHRAKKHGWKLIVDSQAIVKHYWKATGAKSESHQETRSIQAAINLLLGRKSMNNVVDWVNFVAIACPKEYLFINWVIILIRIAHGIFSVFPLYYLRPLLGLINRSIYIAMDIANKIRLNIIQFPEYHLNKD